MQSVTYWLLGSLAGAKWETDIIILPIVIIACLFFWSRYRVLNLMLLGDDVSITLGTDLHKPRHIYFNNNFNNDRSFRLLCWCNWFCWSYNTSCS